jgi:hypothetical protein
MLFWLWDSFLQIDFKSNHKTYPLKSRKCHWMGHLNLELGVEKREFYILDCNEYWQMQNMSDQIKHL